MKRLMLISLVVLLSVGSATAGPKRDVTAIAEQAAKRGLISSPPPGYDFTGIRAEARYKEGELLVRFAPAPDGKQLGSRLQLH